MTTAQLRLFAFMAAKRARLELMPYAGQYEATLRWRCDDRRDFRERAYGATPELALDGLCALMREVDGYERP